jgi:hypothetical protein
MIEGINEKYQGAVIEAYHRGGEYITTIPDNN